MLEAAGVFFRIAIFWSDYWLKISLNRNMFVKLPENNYCFCRLDLTYRSDCYSQCSQIFKSSFFST